MKDGWHTYWQNPGDAGMPTSFTWNLPAGFELLSMKEPAPSRLTEEGITTFVHHDEAIYLFEILAPSSLPDTMSFSLRTDWLECKDICLPGRADLSFTLLGESSQMKMRPEWAELKMKAQRRFPGESKGLFTLAEIKGTYIELVLKKGQEKPLDVDFFPSDELLLDINQAVQLKSRLWKTSVLLPLLDGRDKEPEVLHGVLMMKTAHQDGIKTNYITINQTIQK